MLCLPASLTLSTLCCERGGAALNGPGVPPTEPGDRVSSLPGPEYDSEDDGGRCNNQKKKKKKFNYFSGEIKIIGEGRRETSANNKARDFDASDRKTYSPSQSFSFSLFKHKKKQSNK